MLFLILILTLAAELAFGIFLCGMLLIALVLRILHRHPSAFHELCSARGKLIDTCIFEGVPRENVWLETLYANINSVLLYPEQNLIPLPDDKAPPAIYALRPSLRNALRQVSRRTLGSYLQKDTGEKQPTRLQREKARQFLEMIYRWASRAEVNCSDRRLSETRSMVLRS